MARRVIMNFPASLSNTIERSVIVESIPRIDEYVMYEGEVFRVCKVLHPVRWRGALQMCIEPVVYLAESRVPSTSEKRHQ